jgi:hypothetical protein
MILIKKYSYFLGKINNWRKNQNGGQKPRWRQDNKELFLKNAIWTFGI